MAQAWVANGFGGVEVLELVDIDVPAPGPGEVTIDVRAAGLNPTDYKQYAPGRQGELPMRLGNELAGVVTATGPDTQLASGGGAVGDEVLAFRVRGAMATVLTIPAKDVFAKPAALGFPEAANLLLAGTTAAEMLYRTGVKQGDTIVVHGASGAVGVSVLQQGRELGVRMIGTASQSNFEQVRLFGGEPVAYGEGLEERIRALAPGGVDASLDTVGTDEAVDVSLATTRDRSRILTIAAFGRAQRDGIVVIGGTMPESAKFRDAIRPRLIELAADWKLVVPVARTFPFEEAPAALELLSTGHPGGKLALVR
ncbi:NADP-dependent oxidoreductase [Naasia aerilata]|uniref:Oxidoreductase n=1 Tax=Naasia aerilata TaxID=1162966 RepID=A0ABM8GFL9_9MICO|nr:NADP-dependent oxidoreductase [Naasia aerilata]BDZ47144.1 putative oxidoreductase [Naasia aerilata]